MRWPQGTSAAGLVDPARGTGVASSGTRVGPSCHTGCRVVNANPAVEDRSRHESRTHNGHKARDTWSNLVAPPRRPQSSDRRGQPVRQFCARRRRRPTVPLGRQVVASQRRAAASQPRRIRPPVPPPAPVLPQAVRAAPGRPFRGQPPNRGNCSLLRSTNGSRPRYGSRSARSSGSRARNDRRWSARTMCQLPVSSAARSRGDRSSL